MSGKGIVGWLILAVALAVPGFMFMNWWRMLNSRQPDHGRTVAAAAAAPVFGGTQMAKNLPNPLAPGATSAAAAPAGVEGSSATVAPAANGGVPGAAAMNPALAMALKMEAESAARHADGNAAAPAPDGTLVAYHPVVDRDPMLSPMDVKRLAQAALEKEFEAQRKKREAEEATRRARKRVPSIESTVKLYGITAVRGSISAIVNDQVVHAGETMRNGVRIVKITPTTVTFQHGGKRWTRTMSR